MKLSAAFFCNAWNDATLRTFHPMGANPRGQAMTTQNNPKQGDQQNQQGGQGGQQSGGQEKPGQQSQQPGQGGQHDDKSGQMPGQQK
jgi:hypothetical protein